MSFLMRTARQLGSASTFRCLPSRAYSITSTRMAATLNSENISKITDAERRISGQDQPQQGGPTSAAQSHAGQPINKQTLSDITAAEKKITGQDGPVKGGPTAAAQSILTNSSSGKSTTTNTNTTGTGKLDSDLIATITEKEKEITGQDQPVKGGPTAAAQARAGQPITDEAISEVNKGEATITDDKVKGGPTATMMKNRS